MKSPTVDQIMQQPVYSVDVTDLASTAIQIMEQHGIKKILVKDADSPRGVLMRWMITSSDLSRKVGEMSLLPFGRMPTTTSLDNARRQVAEYAAVYVHLPEDPKKIIGVVTAFDLVRSL